MRILSRKEFMAIISGEESVPRRRNWGKSGGLSESKRI